MRYRFSSAVLGGIVLAALLSAAPATAGEPGRVSPPGQRDLAGIWYRVVYDGAASEAGAIIVVTKVDADTWIAAPVVHIPPLVPPPQYPGFPPTDAAVPWIVQFQRTGQNTYLVTSLSYYSATQAPAGQPKTAWAGVCNGPGIQQDEDTLTIDWYCFASCNPCFPGCWNFGSPYIACDPGRLWDPFQDPTAFCSAVVTPVEFRKVPMSDGCVPD
ncbi:MAG: hypothetical protein MUF27_03305 [Acidobacteria bacterium]|jgi:hypothetical protein|nr:hypothetical protein [Acidobacteriota bacterium]